MVYEWGSRHYPVPAQVVGEIVESLGAKHVGNICPPETFIAAARSKKSPLHPLLTWDVNAAAEKCWVQEARDIIRSIMYVDDATGARLPAFYHIQFRKHEGARVENGYSSIAYVEAHEDYRQQALTEALRYLTGFKRRYQHLEQLSPVFEAIEQVRETELSLV